MSKHHDEHDDKKHGEKKDKKHEGGKGKKHGHKTKIASTRTLTREDLILALEDILSKVRANELSAAFDGTETPLVLPEQVDLRVKATLADDETSFSLKILWPAGRPGK